MRYLYAMTMSVAMGVGFIVLAGVVAEFGVLLHAAMSAL